MGSAATESMATTKKEQKLGLVQTRAEKKDATKNLIREILAQRSVRAGELIDEAAKTYAERFGGEDTENPNDVKGRIGSVLDVMKKDGDVSFDGGMYALKTETSAESTTEKPVKKTTRTRVKKANKAEETETEKKEELKEPAAKKTTRATKKKPLPAAPLQPIAPVAPVTPEVAPEPIPEETENKQEEKPAPKKRGRKAKTEKQTEVAEEAKTEISEVKETEVKPAPAEEKEKEELKKEEPEKEEKKEEKGELVPRAKAELSPKGTVMDMSFLFGEVKSKKKEERLASIPAPVPVSAPALERTAEESPAPQKAEKPAEKLVEKIRPQQEKPQIKRNETSANTRAQQNRNDRNVRVMKKALTPDEKLQTAFLARLHRLGGEYFEYYSVYLLEKYSRRNGRRLESLRVTAGDHDGGIDGEIELTDKLGFRETIYIQSKNWDPDKGDEKLWVVGETLLQQFIGACVCRQAKDGKQNCRGIFITTSRFTPEARRILDQTADKFVGYDGADLYEAAKECEFGVVKKNGEWVLDDDLLSGEKAFFNML